MTTTIIVTSSHSWFLSIKLEIKRAEESPPALTWTFPTGKTLHPRETIQYNRDLPEDSLQEFILLFSMLGFISHLSVQNSSFDELYRLVYSIPFNRNLVIMSQRRCDDSFCMRNHCRSVISHTEKSFGNYGELFAIVGEPIGTHLLSSGIGYFECPDPCFLSKRVIRENVALYENGCQNEITRHFSPLNKEGKVYIELGYDR